MASYVTTADALVTLNGTIPFNSVCGFMDIFREMLDSILTKERGIRWEIMSGADSVLTGTAGAALM